jgi:hypothetical protein
MSELHVLRIRTRLVVGAIADFWAALIGFSFSFCDPFTVTLEILNGVYRRKAPEVKSDLLL